MTIKSAVAVVALAAGLVAGPAFAQDMIGEFTVDDTNRAEVQARCDDLNLESNTSLSDSTEDGADGSDDGADQAGEDDTAGDEVEAEGMDQATTTIDLEAITLEDCETAGFVTAE